MFLVFKISVFIWKSMTGEAENFWNLSWNCSSSSDCSITEEFKIIVSILSYFHGKFNLINYKLNSSRGFMFIKNLKWFQISGTTSSQETVWIGTAEQYRKLHPQVGFLFCISIETLSLLWLRTRIYVCFSLSLFYHFRYFVFVKKSNSIRLWFDLTRKT